MHLTVSSTSQQVARADLGQELGVEAPRLDGQVVQLQQCNPTLSETGCQLERLGLTSKLRRVIVGWGTAARGASPEILFQPQHHNNVHRHCLSTTSETHLPLLVALGQNVLLDSGLGDQAVDVHRPRLPDAMAPILRLRRCSQQVHVPTTCRLCTTSVLGDRGDAVSIRA